MTCFGSVRIQFAFVKTLWEPVWKGFPVVSVLDAFQPRRYGSNLHY